MSKIDKIAYKKIIMKGIVGSHAYGLNHAGSDIDTAGVFVQPTCDVMGMTKYTETITRTSGIDKDADPDITFHEAEKFIKLCMAGNPTVMEQLWLDDYLTLLPEGKMLVEGRKKFLSTAIRDSYGGYARQQFKRLQERGDFSSTLRNRTFKHARHMVRLLLQAQHALLNGELRLKLTGSEIDIANALAELSIEDIERFNVESEELFLSVRECKSDLPKSADFAYCNDVLLYIRESN